MELKGKFKIEWIDRGFEPQGEPDPLYPQGVDLDFSRGATETCQTALPYPAKRCGFYAVLCETCGLSVLTTTAGRIDDPRSLKMACKVGVKT